MTNAINMLISPVAMLLLTAVGLLYWKLTEGS